MCPLFFLSLGPKEYNTKKRKKNKSSMCVSVSKLSVSRRPLKTPKKIGEMCPLSMFLPPKDPNTTCSNARAMHATSYTGRHISAVLEWGCPVPWSFHMRPEKKRKRKSTMNRVSGIRGLGPRPSVYSRRHSARRSNNNNRYSYTTLPIQRLVMALHPRC